jgi:hypothetical protein
MSNAPPTPTAAFSSHVVNCSTPVECWLCKHIKPSLVSINITATAAGATPSVFKPICDDCAKKRGRISYGF